VTRRVFPIALVFCLPALLALQAPRSPAPVITNLLIFAGGESGMFRSRDWGGSWQKVKEGLEGLGSVSTIVPIGPGVYAAGHGGLYASRDFGETWAPVYEEEPVLSFSMSRFPLSDPTMFLGTAHGLLRSPDLGRTVLPTAIAGIPVVRVDWPGPDLLVVTSGGVVVSKDSGRTFETPGIGLPGGETRALATSSYYASDPVLFVCSENLGVFRSRDGAQHWQLVGLGGRKVNDMIWFGPILYAATDSGLAKSENAGDDWVSLGEGLEGAVPQALLFPLAPASGSEVFLGTDRGAFHSLDGGAHWEAVGLKGENLAVLATFPAQKKPTKRR
jgi:photosystem II stability/assembly factor-like uncharacterized protein